MFEHLNRLSAGKLEEELVRCCASQRWVAEMVMRRPFPDKQTVLAASEQIWWSLDEGAWREAFAAHPRIGDVQSLRDKFNSTRSWANNEQSGTQASSEETLQRLADGNDEYESRFGYLFIVCATGKSGDEMLTLLQNRLKNCAADEIRVAALEQLKITQLRLQKLGT